MSLSRVEEVKQMLGEFAGQNDADQSTANILARFMASTVEWARQAEEGTGGTYTESCDQEIHGNLQAVLPVLHKTLM